MRTCLARGRRPIDGALRGVCSRGSDKWLIALHRSQRMPRQDGQKRSSDRLSGNRASIRRVCPNLAVAVVLGAIWFIRQGAFHGTGIETLHDRALDTLRERYTRGEINKEWFEENAAVCKTIPVVSDTSAICLLSDTGRPAKRLDASSPRGERHNGCEHDELRPQHAGTLASG